MALDGSFGSETSASAGASGTAGSALFALMSFAFVGAVLAAGMGASALWGDGGYWAVGIFAAAAVALIAGVRLLRGGAAPVAGGMCIATDTLTGAFFLGIPGAIFASGHDGLAYGLGLGAGGLLMQLVVAPRFARSGAVSLPDLIRRRFPGRVVSLLTLAIITVSMTALLIGGLTAAGLVGMRLLGLDFATATVAAALGVLLCFVVRGTGGTATVNGLLYALLLLALLLPVVMLSAQWYGLPVPQLAYANSLWQLQGMEENLLEQDLADPAYLTPMMTAFLSLSPINFVGLILGLATGVAVLPSLLSVPLAGTSARNARHTALWGLGFVVLVLTLAPAVATHARQAIATLIADRTAAGDLPAWVFTYGKLGLVQVCGQAVSTASMAAQSCAALPDAGTALRLQDIAVDPDIAALALPEIAGLNGALTGLVAIAVMAAVIVTAHALLGVIADAVGLGSSSSAAAQPRGLRLASYAVAASVIAAGTVLATLRFGSIAEIASWGVVIAAAGLFPVVVAALWFRRANTWGALAGMIVGTGALAAYVAAQHYFPVPFFEATAPLSRGGVSGLEYFNELKAAWLDAEPGAAREAAWEALNVHARSVADWWGIRGPATVLLALPLGFLALMIVSLVTPRPETAP